MSDDTAVPAGNAATDEGIRQIPLVVAERAPLSPAGAQAREQLLAAIGSEAQAVAERNPGHGAEALETLARAYALVTAGAPGVEPLVTTQRNSHTLTVAPAKLT
ncbi:hypothetical protein GCM10009639_20970 [Kitasatospora putterlickiae]|uniref:Uncharacterized protein n=1 Tax=Kitasatospora putterlickiae TaxID=221725 RepID=A0ABN1XVH6_9ACTN